MKREYFIVESRGNKKKWKPEVAKLTLEGAEKVTARLERFSVRWKRNREYRIVHVVSV